MAPFLRDHIIINGRTQSLPYTSNITGRSNVIPRTNIDRESHGKNIQQQFNSAVAKFQQDNETEFVYIVFKSAVGFFLDLEKFDKSDFRLASYREIEVNTGNEILLIYEAAVYLNKTAIPLFLKKLEQYINENTLTGNPKNQSLISNIDEVRAATLENFWQEPELPFPGQDENLWWEIWMSRNNTRSLENVIPYFNEPLNQTGMHIGNRFLEFPEHYVFLMQGTARQLGATLLYTDNLAEIRKPKDTADFFTYLERQEQAGWIEDLNNKVAHIIDSTVSLCLLDTGVNLANPLLSNLIPERNLDTVEPAWRTSDSHIQGHGTSMAGLALYGDLTEIFGSTDEIQIFHHLESVKLIERNKPHDPLLYGKITQEAMARGVTLNPENKRVFCMAITTEDFVHSGKPSSWSSAIDQSIFGSLEQPNDNSLFLVSSGNLPIEQRINYPLSNVDSSIQDPAQSFNSITVGAYTLKDRINEPQYSGAELLAKRGGMSPCNTTSICWDKNWSRKPDIVMEGGNQALFNGGTLDADSLQLLSTSKGGIGKPWLTTFGDTSAATALASKFTAELYHSYPKLWPETIRGLVIHSADWTSVMLNDRKISQLPLEEKIKLVSQVGYGVPNMQKARHSANNSLSLIAERTLKPYKQEGSIIKTDEFHLFDLPWPENVLRELFNTQVELKITLSYYIEPNPGTKRYELSASYRSHGLRFKIIDSNESLESFKARISRNLRKEDYESEGSERWILGSQVRDKGSIHKDIWEGPAIDLANRNKIAVYPVSGWWKTRKLMNRFNNSVRYSLIITIETPATDIDIYTPVLNQISVEIGSVKRTVSEGYQSLHLCRQLKRRQALLESNLPRNTLTRLNEPVQLYLDRLFCKYTFIRPCLKNSGRKPNIPITPINLLHQSEPTLKMDRQL